MFETWTEPYDRWNSVTTARDRDPGYQVQLPCTTLRTLIVKGEYERANNIRLEYETRAVPIMKHQVYEQAAIAALQLKNHQDFLDWFNLVPDRALVPGGRSFDTIFSSLTELGPVNISTIIKWALLAAGKGYLRDIGPFIVPYVVYKARSNFSFAMVAGLLENARLYEQRHSHDPTVNASFHASDVVSDALSSAAMGGRKYLGTMLVELALAIGVAPSDSSIAIFMHDLRKGEEVELHHRLTSAVDAHSGLIGKTSTQIEKLNIRRHPIVSTGPMYYALELPRVLRIISSTILTNRPPTTTALAHFIARYTLLGRFRAVFMLRRKVLRAPSLGSKGLWFAAEMKFWLMYGRYDRVVQSYSTYFLRTGIPRGVLQRFLELSATGPPASAGKLAIMRLYSLRPLPIPWKLVASSHVHAMLWSAFARLAPDLHALEETYRDLLEVVDHFIESRDDLHGAVYNADPVTLDGQQANGAASTDNDDHAKPLPPNIRQATRQLAQSRLPRDEGGKAAWRSLPPVMMPDASVFSPFINRFASLVGPQRALQVLRDLHARNMAPGLQTWYYIERAFVRAGDLPGALRVLATVEGFGPPDWKRFELVKTRVRTRFGAMSPSAPAFTQGVASVHFYQIILKRMVSKQMFDDAERFLGRMEALGYRPGFHPEFDLVVARFKEQLADRRRGLTGSLRPSATTDLSSEPRWNPAFFRPPKDSPDEDDADDDDDEVIAESQLEDVHIEDLDVDLDIDETLKNVEDERGREPVDKR
ncbi:hypothetical protein AURDEDRAFT_149880 [Auricularia subglabra TFB-10046 SS5]|nr:hypothetical protein AURDEDRAFT_149880 [Auricularia subglabra TFB-10046 SS5]